MAEKNPKSQEAGRTEEELHEGEFCDIEPGAMMGESGSAGQQIREPMTKTASQVAQQGKQMVGDLAEQGKQVVSDLAGRSKGAASDLVEQIQAKFYELLEGQKHLAADRLGAIGSAIRQVTDKLQGEKDQVIAPYASSTAKGIEEMSHNLHDQDLAELVNRAERFARRQPELFLGASFLGGIMLARFLKTAWSHSSRQTSREPAGKSSQEPVISQRVPEPDISEPGGEHI